MTNGGRGLLNRYLPTPGFVRRWYAARIAGIAGHSLCVTGDSTSAAYDLNRVFLIGSDASCMANFRGPA